MVWHQGNLISVCIGATENSRYTVLWHGEFSTYSAIGTLYCTGIVKFLRFKPIKLYKGGRKINLEINLLWYTAKEFFGNS